MIEAQFTPETFTAFAFEQVRKAASEEQDAARIRILNLRKSIEVAKTSFESAGTAAIPVIEAPSDQSAKPTSTDVPPKTAAGVDHGHTASNQSDVPDLNKKLANLEAELAKLKGEKAKVEGEELDEEDDEKKKVAKGEGASDAWPDDIAETREPEVDWGTDPK